MFEIISFYFNIVGKIFGVYLSWEIFPGVSYLAFVCAAAIMTMLISLIFHNVKEEYDYKMDHYKHTKWNKDISNSDYKGKHSSEGLAKHAKKG